MQPKSQLLLANNIRLALEGRHMSINELASYTGIPLPTIYGIQYQSASRLSSILAIAITLDIPVDTLCCGSVMDFESEISGKPQKDHTLDLKITSLLDKIGQEKSEVIFSYANALVDRRAFSEKPEGENSSLPPDGMHNDVANVICGYSIPYLVKRTKHNVKMMCAMKGITLSNLAHAIGRNVSAIYASMDEDKTRSNFNINLLYDIARYFGVSMEFCIFGGVREIVYSRRELENALQDIKTYESAKEKVCRLLPFLSVQQKNLLIRMMGEFTL